MIILGIEILCLLVLAMILSAAVLEQKRKEKAGMRPVKLKSYWDGSERRSTSRLNVSLEVKYLINGKTLNARSVDISARGIQLTLDEKIEKGEILRLEIKVPGSGETLHATAEAAWSKEATAHERRAGKRLFNTGIKFIKFKRNGEKKLFDFMHTLQPQKP